MPPSLVARCALRRFPQSCVCDSPALHTSALNKTEPHSVAGSGIALRPAERLVSMSPSLLGTSVTKTTDRLRFCQRIFPERSGAHMVWHLGGASRLSAQQ